MKLIDLLSDVQASELYQIEAGLQCEEEYALYIELEHERRMIEYANSYGNDNVYQEAFGNDDCEVHEHYSSSAIDLEDLPF